MELHHKYTAFSLIELMVVIVIVAVLAAVSVPAYKSYVVKSKEGLAMTYLQSIVKKINIYYSTHGSWPASLTEVGAAVTSPTSINDFAISNTAIVGYSPNPLNVAGTCNTYSLNGAIAGLTQDTFTPPSDVGVAISMILQVAVLPGGYKSWCTYYYFDGNLSTPLSGDYVKNCVNMADPVASSALMNQILTETTAAGCPV